ncbi:DNA methyltransferase [Polaribacter sp. Q13]|uniref:class I SAM-dependent DNA methyltransferase n=1 Tax=Polaribacter sp. Q13 TaxID=2806551 RepID=UPI00193C1DCE|nr:DNA methyltransferase [Polaribacter sp. Q13]QVY66876.1 class I SAM-dependent DNA methyltransferase [Polaribacter sp. Q13]
MNASQIEKKLQKLIANFNKQTFIYDLLLVYNLPKATITRLKKGIANLSKKDGEVSLKKKLFFKEELKEDLHLAITQIVKEIKHQQRFVIVTDNKTFLAIDTKTGGSLDIPLKDLPKNYDFFLPWAGMEKAQHQEENLADVKAAVKMARLFDEIKKDNPDNSPAFIHELNVFLSRLLFCFFAEDTNIFTDSQFTNSIESHTQTDGSDLDSFLENLFKVLDIPNHQRENLPTFLNAFPYVNGSLFSTKIKVPTFSNKSRKVLIESGRQDWSNINPDIFGSMFQAVISVDQRGSLGQHYTSVPNIMKVIEPLFLNDLKEAFDDAKGNSKKLNELLFRLKNIKIFDPACGSGNFLIIAYKELRTLEMQVFKELGTMALSEISLSQFYGIELDDFAHEIAILALWLVEHQMNVAFFKEFGRTNPALPLTQAGNIVQGNATRLDWEIVCPKNENDEIYILGNPPYLGSSMQNAEQKSDMKFVFKDSNNYKKQDYISCWFFKAAAYVNNKEKFAFVSTNSVCQGTQVEMTWPLIFNLGLEIFFVHKDFKWSNSAKSNAGVICSIIGLRRINNKPKFIYTDGVKTLVKNINAYLANGTNTIVNKRTKPLSSISKMTSGNKPLDGGNLILDENEVKTLLTESPESKILIRKFIGSSEYIRGKERWCLWISDEQLSLANSIPLIKERLDKVKICRLNGGNNAKNKANVPHRFEFTNEPLISQILVPRVSSIRRPYIPMGFIDNDIVIADSAQVIYDSDASVFSLINSRLHMVWVRITAGRLKSDYRYSSFFSYHTFPIPAISKQRKEELTQCTLAILDERSKHSEKTLAQLYDPDKMPAGLKEAHRLNDLAVERCYRSTPFTSDEERLEYLFKLYEKMIQEEKEKETLFAKEKKTRKTKNA